MRNQKGFTLIEILLVLVIVSVIISTLIGYSIQKTDETRRDRIVMQMQQILNAGLTYYINNGKFPDTGGVLGTVLDKDHPLISSNYIPQGLGTNGGWNNPFGSPYRTFIDTVTNNFYIVSKIPKAKSTPVNAAVISGRLPFGVIMKDTGAPILLPPPYTPTTCSDTDDCYVITQVPVPGQNLNNARSFNYAGIYHAGACVPAPSCPMNMAPQIMVVPVSASGVFDQPSIGSGPGQCTDPYNYKTCNNLSVYPISSYSAWANGDSNGKPVDIALSNIKSCNSSATPPCYSTASGGSWPQLNPYTGKYWRVCMSVVTEKGAVAPNPSQTQLGSVVQGQAMGSVLAITRCVPVTPGSNPPAPNEKPVSSDFKVFEAN